MHDEGMKDFYAGLAMLGLLSAGWPSAQSEGVASIAFDVADAMMEERNRRKESEVNERA